MLYISFIKTLNYNLLVNADICIIGPYALTHYCEEISLYFTKQLKYETLQITERATNDIGRIS